jgi:hypothetical protein
MNQKACFSSRYSTKASNRPRWEESPLLLAGMDLVRRHEQARGFRTFFHVLVDRRARLRLRALQRAALGHKIPRPACAAL